MNLDSLTQTSGEWLRGNGPESDIVISSRIRLARNVAAFPFTNRASAYQKAELEGQLRDRIARLELDPPLEYLGVPTLSQLDRQLLQQVGDDVPYVVERPERVGARAGPA